MLKKHALPPGISCQLRRDRILKSASIQIRAIALVALCLASLVACVKGTGNQAASAPEKTAAPNPENSPQQPSEATGSATGGATSGKPTSQGTYQHPKGLFEISLPKGYQFQETDTGIVFISPDGQFGGVVDYAAAAGKQFNPSQLKQMVRDEHKARFDETSWEGAEQQDDGSIRLDWVGKKADWAYDGVIFVEQKGDMVYGLLLASVNAPYENYQADVEVIVSSYRPGAAPENSQK